MSGLNSLYAVMLKIHGTNSSVGDNDDVVVVTVGEHVVVTIFVVAVVVINVYYNDLYNGCDIVNKTSLLVISVL